MIYLAGVLECHLVIDSGSVSLAPGGVLYDTAVMVRRSVDPRVSVFSRLANDGPGRILLEALVRERIVFDPNLVCESLPSYLVVEDREGRSVTYSGSTSQVCAQSGEMSNALAGNSDVDIVSVLGGGLYYQPLFSSILDSVTFLPQKPYLVLDLNRFKTISIAIQYMKGSYGRVDMGAIMAALILAVIPVIIFYLACQKHIIKGVAAGAVKG